ncbi:MAG: bifunctional diguanylate cyclase/phosphodiesterase [Acidithiobacillus sp.]
MEASSQASRLFWRLLAANAILAAGYAALAAGAAGLHRMYHHGSVMPFWPFAGLAAFAVLVMGWRIAPGIFVGSYLANMALFGWSVPGALAVSLGNTVGPLIGLRVLQRGRPSWSNFFCVGDVGWYLLTMSLLNAGISTLFGLVGNPAFHWDSAFPANFWVSWMIAYASSTILFGPLFYLWWRQSPTTVMHEFSFEAVVLTLLTAVSTALIFLLPIPVGGIAWGASTLLLLTLVWAALRLAPQMAFTLAVGSYVIAVIGISLGLGPYALRAAQDRIDSLGIRYIGLAVAILMVMALVNERRGALLALQRMNSHLQGRIEERTHLLEDSLEQLHARETFYRAITQTHHLLAPDDDAGKDPLDDRLDEVARSLADVLDARLVWIAARTPAAQDLRLLAMAGSAAGVGEMFFANVEFVGPDGPVARAARTGLPAMGDCAEASCASSRVLTEQYGIGGYVVAPFTYADGEGFLAIYRSDRLIFSDDLIDLIQRLAKDLGVYCARRLTDMALLRVRCLYQALISVGDIALTAEDENSLMVSTCRQLIDSGLFTAAWIARPDTDGYFYPLAAAGGSAARALPQRWPAVADVPEGQTVGARAWRSGKLLYVQDYIEDPYVAPWRDFAIEAGWRSVAGVPVLRNQEQWGVLVVIGDQVGIFSEEMLELLARVARLVGHGLDEIALKAALHQEREQQSQLAVSDPLTGLPNRRGLDEHLAQAMARSVRHQKLLAVGMLDLDNFKPINDIHGHEVGDQLLQALAERLQQGLRHTDFVARIGGDEFVLVCEDLGSMADLDPLIGKVQEIFESPFILADGIVIRMAGSLGLALYPDGDARIDADLLLRHADQALYALKDAKIIRHRFWATYPVSVDDIRAASHVPVQKLLRQGALRVFYQPILDAATHRIVGIEALARLVDAELILCPAEFLPHLDNSDHELLTRFVLTQALDDLTRLDAQGLSLWVSVNISAETLQRATSRGWLHNILKASDIAARRLILEILEGTDMLAQGEIKDHIAAIKGMGVRIALDDMGTAYSSLLCLKELPVDEIKLDQGLVRTLANRPEGVHFVNAVLDLAMGLNVQMVVEGAETLAILDALVTLGVPLIQGFAIAPPMDFDSLSAWMIAQTGEVKVHPHSLLGLYAAQMSRDSILRKCIRQNAAPIDYMMLADAESSSLHDDIVRMGLLDTAIDHAHRRYHRACALVGATHEILRGAPDWTAVDAAQDHFFAEIRRAMTGLAPSDSRDA